MGKLDIYDLTGVKSLAKNILANLSVSTDFATVLALRGDLGSGKTTFTQFLAKELGVKNYVTSPTFVIEKKYKCVEGAKFETLIHIDCYRLNSSEEMLNLGWKDMVHNHRNLIIIEWPERIESILPENSVKIDFNFVTENTRSIIVK